MRGRRGAVLLALVVLAALLPAHPAAGDGLPPTISDLRWTPRFPIAPSNVTLHANITDPDGFSEVYATWCTLDGFCIFPTMYDEGGGAHRANATTPLNTIGAAYQVFATDTFGNRNNSPKIYVLFVDSVYLTLDPLTVASPGGVGLVNGTAFYGPRFVPYDGANESVPAEGLLVEVMVQGASETGTVDENGDFSIPVTAPLAEGAYPVEATATDRTLTDTAQSTLAVSAVPRPDLVVANARLSPPYPVAGDIVTLDFDVRNQGTADAEDAPVVVRVAGFPDPVFNELLSVPQGESVHRTTTWRAVAGTIQVIIQIDPDDAIAELDEGNNLHGLSLPVSSPAPYLWIGVGGVAVAAAIGAAWAMRRRRSRDPSPMEPEGGKNT